MNKIGAGNFDEHQSEFLREILAGLGKRQKEIPSKWFYNETGSSLFEEICELEEYYPTRTEIRILHDNIKHIVDLIKPGTSLIELGSGNGKKIRILLDVLTPPYSYIPVDISHQYLFSSSKELQNNYQDINIVPVHADFTKKFVLPDNELDNSKLIFFPGSSIGNFSPSCAIKFMSHIRKTLGSDCNFLIGIDLKKDIQLLEAAYNDKKGITAKFNSNILLRANNELGANFHVNLFDHKAIWNKSMGRVEMHLISKLNQEVIIKGNKFFFKKGETIHTENSYKYTLDEIKLMVKKAGWHLKKSWIDSEKYFSVNYLT
ncbi:MAG: L-histidine N(alpha)-methyltransferase [Rhodospirillaceae bacterium]|nr:L-histidine N(alpha)-methyltransferase [Rhodospirillaceae bacterium]|tara:strand:+ start:3036 stop:3986 length:951 start_codon:yes stop_codon:yes gene_type:complete